MNNPELLFNLLGLGSLIAIISLAFTLMLKIDKIKQLQTGIDKLETILKEMDEQAKLVVRTDMELNKTQEELDKKISGLYALQKLSRAISTTLAEKEMLKKLEPVYLQDLGFEKALLSLWDEKEKRFNLHLHIGYLEEELGSIRSFLELNKQILLNLIREEKPLSSISKPQDTLIKEKLNPAFYTNHFIIAPILPKEGGKGFLLVGSADIDTAITQGDEELITILANQLGQALENARLFEKTWLAHQELEKKVEERTRELSQVLEEVKLSSKRKSDFVSSVSHELRTPLTSIKGYASILLSEKLGALPEEVKQRLEKINNHSDELAQFVNDLLDLSRLESGRVIMKQENHDLGKIAEEVADLLSVILKEKRIELSLYLPEETRPVFVDYNQIKRVFINLINNAIKFTLPQGRITVQCHKINTQVQVDIADTGCGIPEDALEKIFEEFYRVDNIINQQTKGTGLGLTLVKNIIEAHQGKIWVKSKIGEGSTFSFTLPQATG